MIAICWFQPFCSMGLYGMIISVVQSIHEIPNNCVCCWSLLILSLSICLLHCSLAFVGFLAHFCQFNSKWMYTKAKKNHTTRSSTSIVAQKCSKDSEYCKCVCVLLGKSFWCHTATGKKRNIHGIFQLNYQLNYIPLSIWNYLWKKRVKKNTLGSFTQQPEKKAQEPAKKQAIHTISRTMGIFSSVWLELINAALLPQQRHTAHPITQHMEIMLMK